MQKLIWATITIVLLVCFSYGFSMTYGSQTEDQPLKITKKPRAYGRDCGHSHLIVRLNVTFDKSATISSVEILDSSGCKSFDKNAIKAARKIEFIPATKNGEPITVTRVVEYEYTFLQ